MPSASPKYGWIHVADWLPAFLGLTLAASVALVITVWAQEPGFIVAASLCLTVAVWPLCGFILSWAKKDTDAWYRGLVEAAVKTGEEKILDVGCGLGRSTVAVAKALRNGTVIGVDVYSRRALWGNSLLQASRNATIEGVEDRTFFRFGDASSLPFDAQQFDVVVAAYVTHELRREQARVAMVQEVFRVLRSGGRFVSGEIPRSHSTFKRYLWFGFWFLPLAHLEDLRRAAGFVHIRVNQAGRPVIITATKPRIIGPTH